MQKPSRPRGQGHSSGTRLTEQLSGRVGCHRPSAGSRAARPRRTLRGRTAQAFPCAGRRQDPRGNHGLPSHGPTPTRSPRRAAEQHASHSETRDLRGGRAEKHTHRGRDLQTSIRLQHQVMTPIPGSTVSTGVNPSLSIRSPPLHPLPQIISHTGKTSPLAPLPTHSPRGPIN